MSNREERLPTRGAFCKHCGKPPHACGCDKHDMRTLDSWDEPLQEPKSKVVEKALNDREPEWRGTEEIRYEPNASGKLEPVAHKLDVKKVDRKVPRVDPFTNMIGDAGDNVVQTHAGGSIAMGATAPFVSSAAVAISSASMIERAIAHVHSLARHLLNLEDKSLDLLKVGVMPLRDGEFRAVVEYDGFAMQHDGPNLDAALNALLTDLINRVGERVARGDELIAEVQGQ